MSVTLYLFVAIGAACMVSEGWEEHFVGEKAPVLAVLIAAALWPAILAYLVFRALDVYIRAAEKNAKGAPR